MEARSNSTWIHDQHDRESESEMIELGRLIEY